MLSGMAYVSTAVSRLLSRTALDLERVADTLQLHQRTLQHSSIGKESADRRRQHSVPAENAPLPDRHRVVTDSYIRIDQSVSSYSSFTRCSHRCWGKPQRHPGGRPEHIQHSVSHRGRSLSHSVQNPMPAVTKTGFTHMSAMKGHK